MPDLAAGLAHPWLQNALCGAAIVAVVAAIVGTFVVMRGASFATHALSQIGFAGAAGAVYAGVPPAFGLIAFSLLGAFGLGALSLRSRSSDVPTALVLVASLGTGALFLALTDDFGSDVTSFLFGTIVGVARAQVAVTFVAALCALAVLAVIARPLLFATVARDAARSAGVDVAALDVVFLVVVGLAAAITVPIVGALLVFALTIGPAAAASRLCTRPAAAFALAIVLGLIAAGCGVALAYETDWPVGFFISAIALLEYVVARAIR
ncbi:MAG: metal ABC transporter permease [Candidatus Eremiobacteraeota bacterium]|nr:metal ABC transporter permease [Candidatus Eremiobacteraeota bacterium]